MTTLKYNYNVNGIGGFFVPGPAITENASTSETKAGWTFGGGVKIPHTSAIGLKSESLFTRFSGVKSDDNKIQPLTAAANPPDFPCGTPNTGLGQPGGIFPIPNPTPRQCFNHNADLVLPSFRLGLNFKF